MTVLPNWGLYNELRPIQIDNILMESPIAFLPWGAIEYHGVHNPIGLDSIKARHLCVDLAMKTGGLVMPVVDLSANLIKSFPGVSFKKHSLEFSEKLVRMICQEYLDQLAEQDFKVIVLLSGHAGEPHLQILKTVAQEFNKKQTNTYCWALAEFDILPNELLMANHSGLGETSIQLYYAHETVDLEALPREREITLEMDAVSGEDPRHASTMHGEAITKAFINKASEQITILMEKYGQL